MKKTLTAAVFAATLCSTSCLGPNNAFNGLQTWNSGATESKWWNEAINLGLWIVPVYSLALLGDIVIFNSIEWWGGNNPLSEPEPFKPQGDM